MSEQKLFFLSEIVVVTYDLPFGFFSLLKHIESVVEEVYFTQYIII